MNEAELVKTFREQFKDVDVLENQLEKAKQALEQTKQRLLEMFEMEGKERTASYSGVGFISRVKPRLYANCNEEYRPVLLEHLRKEGYEGIIKEQVNPQTLSAWVSEQISNGKQVPEFISYVLKPNIRLYDA